MAEGEPEVIPWSTHTVTLHDDIVIKRFTGATRGDADREWAALVLLSTHAPGFAPAPLERDVAEGCILMSRLPGSSVSTQVRLDAAQVSRVVAALERSLTAIPSDELAALPLRSGHPSEHLSTARTRLAALAPHPDPEVERVRREALSVLSSKVLDPHVAPHEPSAFGVGDFNLANFIDDGAEIRLVDFEDAGRSDRAVELADFVEHLSSRANPYPVWRDALGVEAMGPHERLRYEATRIIAAISWLWLLFPGMPGDGRNPSGACASQAARLDGLLRDWPLLAEGTR